MKAHSTGQREFMNVQKANWNVVVVGRWNPAILTPMGIAKRILSLAEGTPLDVLVAVNSLEAPRVRYEGVQIQVSDTHLIISAETCDMATLDRARDYAKTAITNLPETPFSGVGVNFRYVITNPSAELVRKFECPLDTALSDARYPLGRLHAVRSIAWREGTVNIQGTYDEGSFTLLFNFDRAVVEHDQLLAWLSIPMHDIKELNKNLLHNVLQIAEGDTDE